MDISGLKREEFVVEMPFGDAVVTIAYVSPEELRKIARQATGRSWDRRHQPKEELDQDKANILLGRKAVRGWRGFVEDGQEVPYSPEECDRLINRWGEFSRFVNEVCTDLQALQEQEKQATLKN